MKKPVLFFDVIGTVVDWKSAIARAGSEIAPEVDWYTVTKAWLHEEFALQRRVESGEVEWLDRDQLQRFSLDDALPKVGLGQLGTAEKDRLARAWDECLAWPDVIEGMELLRRTHTLVALSNSTVQALTNLAAVNGIAWDVVLSAELFRAYKPNPRVYTQACRVLAIEPAQATMVAAHEFDLHGAMACGLNAAFVTRPTGDRTPEKPPFIVAKDFSDLAARIAGEK